MFEINNSQQKSDRGMKISTFPAVKPFIKLTRRRIGGEKEGGGSDVWKGGREQEGSRCSVRQRGGGMERRESDVGNRGEGKEAKFVWKEGESHLEDSGADRRGGAVCHSKKSSRYGWKEKFDIGV